MGPEGGGGFSIVVAVVARIESMHCLGGGVRTSGLHLDDWCWHWALTLFVVEWWWWSEDTGHVHLGGSGVKLSACTVVMIKCACTLAGMIR